MNRKKFFITVLACSWIFKISAIEQRDKREWFCLGFGYGAERVMTTILHPDIIYNDLKKLSPDDIKKFYKELTEDTPMKTGELAGMAFMTLALGYLLMGILKKLFD